MPGTRLLCEVWQSCEHPGLHAGRPSRLPLAQAFKICGTAGGQKRAGQVGSNKIDLVPVRTFRADWRLWHGLPGRLVRIFLSTLEAQEVIRPTDQVARISTMSISCARPGVELCGFRVDLTPTYGGTYLKEQVPSVHDLGGLGAGRVEEAFPTLRKGSFVPPWRPHLDNFWVARHPPRIAD